MFSQVIERRRGWEIEHVRLATWFSGGRAQEEGRGESWLEFLLFYEGVCDASDFGGPAVSFFRLGLGPLLVSNGPNLPLTLASDTFDICI
jgi:hypothetical protein